MVALREIEGSVFAHPVDCLPQPLFEAELRLPAENFPSPLIRGAESVDLAVVGSDPLMFGLHDRRHAEQARDRIQELTDRDIPASTEIDFLPRQLVNFGGTEKTGYGVGNKRKVSPGMQTTKTDSRSVKQLGDDGRNHRPCRLARPEGIEWTHRHDRQVTGADR